MLYGETNISKELVMLVLTLISLLCSNLIAESAAKTRRYVRSGYIIETEDRAGGKNRLIQTIEIFRISSFNLQGGIIQMKKTVEVTVMTRSSGRGKLVGGSWEGEGS